MTSTPITTELRDAFVSVHAGTETSATAWLTFEGETFYNLCDAIDSIHANLERENASLKAELDRLMGEQDRDGWVELPKDADGVTVRVGDVMKGETVGGGFGEPFEVVGYIMSNGELEPMDEHKQPRKRKYLRHHHEPTVEDVLREMLDAWGELPCNMTNEAIVAEYAKRLQLREVDE